MTPAWVLTPAYIVRKLSAAQRRALLEAEKAEWGKDVWLIRTEKYSPTYRALHNFSLINPVTHSSALTDLGLAVRKILEEQEG